MSEIEFKFVIPAQRLPALQKELARAKVVRTHLQARYFDTADGLLAKSGAALRLRKEGRRWVQTAKALGEGALHRLEHNVDLGMAPRGAQFVADVRRHEGTPVGDMLLRLLGDTPLVETFATDIWRSSRLARLGRSVVELALDTGRVIAPATSDKPANEAKVCELELELVQGSVADLVTLAHRWSQRHGLWFSTVSKAERGERLRKAQQEGPEAGERPAVKATPPRFAGAAEGKGGHLQVSAAELQRAVVSACLAQILPNATEIASGASDIAEHIHQLRVGIRRLRTALRELDEVAPGAFDLAAWAPSLVDVFRALGAQRDQDVLSAKLQPQLKEAGAPLAELPSGDAGGSETPSPADLVKSPAFQQVLVALIGFAAPTDSPAIPDKQEAVAVRGHIAGRLNKLHRQLRKAGKEFESLPVKLQHRARKRLKRLRYLAEFTAPLFDKDKAARYVEQILPAQDALGDYNDDVVAIDAYRGAAEQDARAWFAVGWLSAKQPAQAGVCAKALMGLGKGRKFWN